jgi:hypothetical protein
MNYILRKLVIGLGAIGVDAVKLLGTIRGIPGYLSDYRKFKSSNQDNAFRMSFYPIMADRFKQGGTTKGHYFHQDLLVAQMIYDAKPDRHVDVGSRIDGFVAHLASFRKVTVIDIRALNSDIKNIDFHQADMMSPDTNIGAECDSLSCLHALEHFGLGRYGDPIDPEGHLRGFENLYHLLQQGGTLYFSVPIGDQRIEFNAHRVFSVQYLLNMFDGKFDVMSFSYVDDSGDLQKDVELDSDAIADNFGCDFGCGIFELRKL